MLIVSLLLLPFGNAFFKEETASAKMAGGSSGEQQGEIRMIQEGALASAFVEERKAFRLRSGGKTVQECLYEGLYHMEPSIDISEYHLTSDEFVEVLAEVTNSSPDLFFVGGHIFYNVDSVTDEVTQYQPQYLYGTDVEQMKLRFEATVSRILAGVEETWGDREKALYIHDYLVSRYQYDESCSHYDAYSLLVEGRAVCQGYALAYLYFMKRLGIPCATLPSEEMGHMWNLVQIDGQWYHVDLTYDDPLPDMPGLVRHDCFLLSDEGIASDSGQGHRGWSAQVVCGDTAYDSEETTWKKSIAPFVFDGNDWYYANTVSYEGNSFSSRGGIYRWDAQTDSSEKVLDLSGERWYVGANSIYPLKYMGLVYWDGKLYYNTSDSIQCVSVKNFELPQEAVAVQLSSLQSIYGLWEENGALKYSVGTGWNEIVSKEEALVMIQPTPEPTVGPVLPPVDEGGGAATQNPVSPDVTSPAAVIPNETQEYKNTASGLSESPAAPAENKGDVNTEGEVSEPDRAADDTVLENIKITAKKGKKKIVIRTPERAKAVIKLKKKILQYKKKRVNKITVSASKNKTGRITCKLRAKLKKNMKVTVIVYLNGKKYTRSLRVK